MNYYEHYRDFLDKNNIYNIFNSYNIKCNRINPILFIFLILIQAIGLYFFTDEVINKEIPISKAIFRWPFLLIMVVLIFFSGITIRERIRLYKQIRRQIGDFEQNLFSVVLDGVNWDAIILKYYWFDRLYIIYGELETVKINFFKHQNDIELANRSAPKFLIKLSEIIASGSTIVSVLSYILLALGVGDKDQRILVVLIFLVFSPIIYVAIIFFKTKFDRRKIDYKNMLNYSLALEYILRKREMNK